MLYYKKLSSAKVAVATFPPEWKSSGRRHSARGAGGGRRSASSVTWTVPNEPNRCPSAIPASCSAAWCSSGPCGRSDGGCRRRRSRTRSRCSTSGYEARDAAQRAVGRPEMLLGHSAPIAELERTVERLAHVELPILLLAEFGCQQLAVATLLHVSGSRRRGPFVVFNCVGCDAQRVHGDLSDSLVQAQDGTLFLEGLNRMDPSAWYPLSALVRELGSHRLGAASRPRTRLITSVTSVEGSAGSVELPADLLACIDVVRVEIPALRFGREDVATIVDHVAQEMVADSDVFEPSALELLRDPFVARKRRRTRPGDDPADRPAGERAGHRG